MYQAIRLGLLFLCLCVVPGVSIAGVYKCLDRANKVFYQDKSCKELTSTGLSPALAQLAPAESRPRMLWKLESENKTVYLMGSLTYGSGDMYPLPESIMDVFSSSNVLIVGNALEAGGTSASHAAVAQKGAYSNGSNLQSHIKPTTWERVQSVAKTFGISEEVINTQKPWMAALTLKTAAMKKAGVDPAFSTDKTFIQAAAANKPIMELDPIDEQLADYEALSDEEAEAFLLEALHEADSTVGYFDALIKAWKQGDTDAAELLLRRALDSLPASLRRTAEMRLASRNKAMADKIAELAADGRTYFVLIDVGRLAGEQGVLSLLRGRGFRAGQL